ncbi:MAG: hypothetical protein K0Q59_3447 [Paenibacillus sp.]|jgi:hypothetical protein|nr:hypothetical protein [Paenibacillus sp.]
MKLNGKSGLAIVLIACGLLIIISKLGFGLGHLIGYLFPIVLLGLGYYGIRNGRTFFGWLFLIIGLLGFISKFTWIIAILFAAGCIYYGITILKKKRTF